jgi:hypothetical protein
MAGGLSAVTVVNLFSWRATRPVDLKTAAREFDIVGEQTDETIVRISQSSGLTLAAWGAHGSLYDRGRAVAQLLNNPVCLGLTKHGEPSHPLYVSSTVPLQPYDRP